MKKILTGLAFSILLFGCSSGSSDSDVVATGCDKKGCPTDSICYNSQASGIDANNAPVIGEQEGDLKCHLKCVADSDCGQGEFCQKVEMHGSDLYWFEQFCLAK